MWEKLWHFLQSFWKRFTGVPTSSATEKTQVEKSARERTLEGETPLFQTDSQPKEPREEVVEAEPTIPSTELPQQKLEEKGEQMENTEDQNVPKEGEPAPKQEDTAEVSEAKEWEEKKKTEKMLEEKDVQGSESLSPEVPESLKEEVDREVQPREASEKAISQDSSSEEHREALSRTPTAEKSPKKDTVPDVIEREELLASAKEQLYPKEETGEKRKLSPRLLQGQQQLSEPAPTEQVEPQAETPVPEEPKRTKELTKLQTLAHSLPHPLPQEYGRTRVHLLEVEPERAYVFYEVSPREPAFLKGRLWLEVWGDEELLFEGSLFKHKDGFDLWLPRDGLTLRAHLSVLLADGNKVTLAMSPSLTMGRRRPAPATGGLYHFRQKATLSIPDVNVPESQDLPFESTAENTAVETTEVTIRTPLAIPTILPLKPIGLYTCP